MSDTYAPQNSGSAAWAASTSVQSRGCVGGAVGGGDGATSISHTPRSPLREPLRAEPTHVFACARGAAASGAARGGRGAAEFRRVGRGASNKQPGGAPPPHSHAPTSPSTPRGGG